MFVNKIKERSRLVPANAQAEDVESAHPPDENHITSFRRTSRKDVFFMSYDSLRNSLSGRLVDFLPPEQMQRVLYELDILAAEYDILPKPKDLIVYGDVPEVVKMYIAACAVRNLTPGTIQHYLQSLTVFFQTVKKPYDKITANDIRVYLYQYKEKRNVSPATIEHIRITFDSFFDWLVEEEYVERNPARKVARIRTPAAERQALDQLELEKVRMACQTLREKALVDFLVSTGVRVSECAALLKSDLDWHEHSVNIRHGKGDKQRITYFGARAELSLRTYLMSRTDDSPYLFVSEREPHNGIKKAAIEMIIRGIWKRSGIEKKLTPHIFRYTFATIQLERGMPLEQVQALAGHSNPSTTLIYAKINKKDLQRNHEKFGA